MKPALILSAALFLFAGCLRPDKEFYGRLNVSGVVTDKKSGQPIPGATVHLYGIVQKQGVIGYSGEPALRMTDTTDAAGTYAFSYEASGETGFDLGCAHSDEYLFYTAGSVQSDQIRGIGNYTRNLSCVRTAFARVKLQNTGSRDTAAIRLSTPVDHININRQVRDTVLILRIYGERSIANSVRFTSNSGSEQLRELKAGAGDTVNVSFDF